MFRDKFRPSQPFHRVASLFTAMKGGVSDPRSSTPPPVVNPPQIRHLVLFSLIFLALVAIAALLWLPADDSALAQSGGAPRITAGPVIASSPADGDSYGAGEKILVALTWNEPLTVTVNRKTGGPRARLDVGDRIRWARYERSERDGARLVFAYTVRGEDSDPDGVRVRRNGLKLAGGRIEDADGNAAKRKHPALNGQSGHKVNAAPAPTATPTPTPTPRPQSPADRPGVVSLNLERDPPTVGSKLSASLLDPDGVVGDVAWSWQSSSDGQTWEAIAGATGASYTATEDDEDYYLRASAAYTDGYGPGKSASAATSGAVVAPVAAAPPVRPDRQVTTHWSATLTVGKAGNTYGCDNTYALQGNCSDTSVLTDDDFTYAGVTYTISFLHWSSTGNTLDLLLAGASNSAAKTALSGLTLNVNGTAFAFSNVTLTSSAMFWIYDPSPDWTDGQTVSLSLTSGAPAPTPTPTPRPTATPTPTPLPVAGGKPANFNVARGPGYARVHADNRHDTYATLTWDNPNEASIAKYQYRQKSRYGSFGGWTDIPDSDANTTSHTVTGLTTYGDYYYQLRAVDKASKASPAADANHGPQWLRGGSMKGDYTLSQYIRQPYGGHVFARTRFYDIDDDDLSYRMWCTDCEEGVSATFAEAFVIDDDGRILNTADTRGFFGAPMGPSRNPAFTVCVEARESGGLKLTRCFNMSTSGGPS